MMREQLRKFPNFFSLPGETDIKTLMNTLAQSGKKGTRSKVQSQSEDNNLALANVSNSESEKWKHVLKRVAAADHTLKPECIYKVFVNEIEKKGINIICIPNKKQIKVKIAALKRSEKRRIQRSIV